ncbi:ABC transporter ATP-binding protein [Actinomadura vinacea]|uniref:ABC transporter ATP-binding protein n=1 Tax=Actinomadura vinacea TaxID=115336 RepID=A0ABN3KC42_9ACTN
MSDPLAREDPPELRLDALSKVYPGQREAAVSEVSLTLPGGRMLALLGPSGCGKTTTLRMIAGLVKPTGGRVLLAGDDLTRTPVHRRGMGMVFQSYALFPHLDVARNVAFGLEMRNVGKAERRKRVAEALDLVRLGHLASRRVGQLSGGQQQRVALARAMVVRPALLLLDEPLSNLDAKLREAMRDEIRELQRAARVTTVFVTHDQDEALSMADTVAVMSEGEVAQVGAPEEIYERPATRFVADFIGRANLLTGTVVAQRDGVAEVAVEGCGTLRARADGPVSGEVTVLLRPHRLSLLPAGTAASADADRLSGTVESASYTGGLISYRVRLGDRRVSVEQLTGSGPAWAPGSEIDVTWPVADARVLAA